MHNTLSAMWYKYNLLNSFKIELNKKGYSSRDLYGIESQLNILSEFIEIESFNVLSNFLKAKTYFRLLKSISKGIEYLPEIVLNSEGWVLNHIDNDNESCISKDVLIFITKANILVFSKISRNDSGLHYEDGKYQ